MTPTKGLVSCCAVLVASVVASAGEVPGQPVCRSCKPVVSRYDPCCDPCQVGPVRRFFRRVFRPCCPPPCPAPAVVVPAPVFVPPPAPRAFVPPAGPPLAPPPAVVPGTESSYRREAAPPVRVDRIASRRGG